MLANAEPGSVETVLEADEADVAAVFRGRRLSARSRGDLHSGYTGQQFPNSCLAAKLVFVAPEQGLFSCLAIDHIGIDLAAAVARDQYATRLVAGKILHVDHAGI